jgi:hypothetical protein
VAKKLGAGDDDGCSSEPDRANGRESPGHAVELDSLISATAGDALADGHTVEAINEDIGAFGLGLSHEPFNHPTRLSAVDVAGAQRSVDEDRRWIARLPARGGRRRNRSAEQWDEKEDACANEREPDSYRPVIRLRHGQGTLPVS